MKKMMLLALIAFTGFCGVSNAQKYGYINVQDLIMVMPEFSKVQEKYKMAEDSLNNVIEEIYNEAREKDSIFGADSAKWTPAKKDIKFKELMNLQTTFQSYQASRGRILEQKQEELLQPVYKVATDAIQAVAKTNGYSYIFNSQSLLVSPPSDDILPLVKKYLKIGVSAPATPASPK
jgi:outer membrane protein